MKLYEISEDIRAAGSRLAEGIDEHGEIPADLEAQLDALQLSFEHKADDCCAVRAELLAEVGGYTVEIERLTKLRDAAQHRADWLKAYLLRCMMAAGIDKVAGERFKLRIQKNSRPAIQLADGADIPEQFKRVRVEFDNPAAYEAWKAGEELPACVIVKEGVHLRIT